MKISILTQPLGHNYGGLLQAYALQKYLQQMGHEPVTLDRRHPGGPLKALKHFIRNLLKLATGKIQTLPSEKKKKAVDQNLIAFRHAHISMSPCIKTQQALLAYYRENSFGAAIVGSDQVWRPTYSPCLPNFYLDFLDTLGVKVKRLSYAASFGVDSWEYSPKDTEQCRELAHKFDAISVREQSAVELCKKHFGIDAEWVIDPTLLLNADDYRKLLPASSSPAPLGKVFSYILDAKPEVTKIPTDIARELDKELHLITPHDAITYTSPSSETMTKPKVEEWIQQIAEADFVVTDSFHGCVFSIIFNKPFIAIGNRRRGLSRFHSLLSIFGLETRLIGAPEEATTELVNAPIEWSKVNNIHQQKREAAKAFLDNNLVQQ
ncbi:polysaccharide pyruvyl transferase family protein [Pseudomaricurvus sp.]|uniref:polysaccharide pyruvyl transferase family protein n=1 Tax=Pseudomaricurvus sp. TaxID=2004510 RepID=UPI003F6CAE96